LKENLAAALLYACEWPQALEQGCPLVDPMCGSGTLLIEAAMMACDYAPGIHRHYFGFEGWKGHESVLWAELLEEAKNRRRSCPVDIAGADHDLEAVEACRHNLLLAGLDEVVTVGHLSLAQGSVHDEKQGLEGLLITNPPYGERLSTDTHFYSELGKNLSRHYSGWHCALFTASSAPHSRIRLPMSRTLQVRNGGIDCLLLTGDIPSTGGKNSGQLPPALEGAEDLSTGTAAAKMSGAALYRGPKDDSADVVRVGDSVIDPSDFINRVKKNQRSLKGWLKQNNVNAYRLYDSDLPDYAVAIDIYEGSSKHCVVQEYQAPRY